MQNKKDNKSLSDIAFYMLTGLMALSVIAAVIGIIYWTIIG